MKSICIKFSNQNELDNLIIKLNKSVIENSKISLRKFRIFYNMIIHYFGNEEKYFFYQISIVIADFIIEKYEKKFIKRCIDKNYFYFDNYEKEIIIKICLRILELQEEEFEYKKEILTQIVYEYICNNKNFFLEGFINFRIRDYLEILEYVVELSVMNYIKYL